MAAKKRNFEEAMKRLEEIVREMEGGDLSLEKMMTRFEEGGELVTFCSGKLNEVEKKIEKLLKKDDDALVSEPLELDLEEPAE